jgi:hypothetical protein
MCSFLFGILFSFCVSTLVGSNFFPLAFTVLQGIPCFAWIGKLKPIYQRIADRFSGAGLPSYAN